MSGGGASSFGTTQTSGTAPESLLGKNTKKIVFLMREKKLRNKQGIFLRIY